MKSGQDRALFVDRVDTLADRVRVLDLAVLGLSESGGAGPEDFRAIRGALCDLAAHIDALRPRRVPGAGSHG